MARLSIYYGRIVHLTDDGPQQTMFNREPIREAVESATSVERYRHEWVLGNLVTDEGSGTISGRLGYPQTDHGTSQDYNATTHEFVEREYVLPAAASGAFVLDYRTGRIAFEGDDIGPTGFINHFVALLNNAGELRFKGELERFAETYREFVGSVDKVIRVTFEVRPTNPRDKRIFRPMDEGLKAANAERQRVMIENKQEGLRLVPPDSVDDETANPAIQGIEMNEDGYGDGYKIDGERDGHPLRYDSTAGGSLIKDVIEDAPPDPEVRAMIVRDAFVERPSDLTSLPQRYVSFDEPSALQELFSSEHGSLAEPEDNGPVAELGPAPEDDPEEV